MAIRNKVMKSALKRALVTTVLAVLAILCAAHLAVPGGVGGIPSLIGLTARDNSVNRVVMASWFGDGELTEATFKTNVLDAIVWTNALTNVVLRTGFTQIFGYKKFEDVLAVGSRNGTYARGKGSLSNGNNVTASGNYSHAEGDNSEATNLYAHAEGSGACAYGEYSHAEGEVSIATGIGAHAEGAYCEASGWISHAEGEECVASGDSSHAEGMSTVASGYNAHSEGDITQAIGDYAHAEGNSTRAVGEAAHAEGTGALASGKFSHAEGVNTCAIGNNSHAEGGRTAALGMASHADGVLAATAEWYAENTHSYSNAHMYAYAWSGIATNGFYYSHGQGTFNVNPEGGASGFYIGETSLVDLIQALAPAPDLSVCVQTNALQGQTFDFATMQGVYLALKACVETLGGSVTNFPAIP